MSRFRFGLVVLGFAFPALALFGCTLFQPRGSRYAAKDEISKEELRDLLEQCQDSVEVNIRQAADALIAAEPTRKTRRLCLLWQMQLIPATRQTLDQSDPLRGMLDLWTLCVRMEQFFRTGDGSTYFGAHQAIAIDAAHQCTLDVEEIAQRIVMPSKFAAADQAVDELAAKFPIRGEFRTETVRIATESPDQLGQTLNSVLDITLVPFRALQGVDRTASAIQGFTVVAGHLTDVVQSLPQDTRLQAELLAFNLEDMDSIESALKSLEQVGTSSTRLANVAETLPESLRRELTLTFEDLEKRQAAFQKTLQEARAVVQDTHAVVKDVNTALQQVDESVRALDATAQTVNQTADSTARAGDAWVGTFHALQDMVQSFRAPAPGSWPADSQPATTNQSGIAIPAGIPRAAASDPGGAEEKSGFDINDYTRTAEALEAAARQMQVLTQDVRSLAESRELTGAIKSLNERIDTLVTETRSSASVVTDHLVWRLGQLSIFVFALLIVYRLLASRVLTPRRGDGRITPAG